MGTDYLATMLNRVLEEHIRARLPQVATDIARKLAETEREVVQLGRPVQTASEKKGVVFEVGETE